MQSNYLKSLAFVLKEEGGNDDDPHDHGGRTSRGITQREYNAWRSSHDEMPADVWKAPQSAIESIYKAQYWDPYCDDFPAGVDLMFFNICVNAGRLQAVRLLQKALNVNVDGMLGVVSKDAILKSDAPTLIKAYGERIEIFYRNLAQFSRYGKGWLSRLNRCIILSLSMARGAPSIVGDGSVKYDVSASPKADQMDLAQPPVTTATAASASATTGIAASVTDQLQQASASLQPLSETFKWAKYICIAIAVIAAGLMIYAVIHNNRMAREA